MALPHFRNHIVSVSRECSEKPLPVKFYSREIYGGKKIKTDFYSFKPKNNVSTKYRVNSDKYRKTVF